MNSSDLQWAGAAALSHEIRAKRISARAVTADLLARIDRFDSALNSFITRPGAEALAEAETVDAALADGRDPGRLAGVPVTVKDQIFTKGLRTTGGSSVYADYVPTEDSIHVARLRAAGAVVTGKTNTPEFGMYWRTIGNVARECLNPWDRRRTAGGSSGGAAAALAAGFGPVALGSDAGGSIRLPSAQCGVFGLLPSLGRVPRHGGFGSSHFFSCVGPMAREVRDAARLLSVIAQPYEDDPFCRLDTPPDYLAGIEDGIAGQRIGWWDNVAADGFSDPRILAATREAFALFGTLGATLIDDALRFDTTGVDEAWKVMDFADRYASLGQDIMADPDKAAHLAPYARTRFDWSATLPASDYSRAIDRRWRLIRDLDTLFRDVDLLVSPTLGIISPVVDPNDLTLRIPALVSYTLPVNMAGYCAASVPCGFVDGLPIGMQIIGRPNEEARVLQAARAFEKARPWNHVHPDLSEELAQ